MYICIFALSSRTKNSACHPSLNRNRTSPQIQQAGPGTQWVHCVPGPAASHTFCQVRNHTRYRISRLHKINKTHNIQKIKILHKKLKYAHTLPTIHKIHRGHNIEIHKIDNTQNTQNAQNTEQNNTHKIHKYTNTLNTQKTQNTKGAQNT